MGIDTFHCIPIYAIQFFIFRVFYSKCIFHTHILYLSEQPPKLSQIARFMGPTRDPPGADVSQVGPMLTPWTLLSWCVSFAVNDYTCTKYASYQYKNIVQLMKRIIISFLLNETYSPHRRVGYHILCIMGFMSPCCVPYRTRAPS